MHAFDVEIAPGAVVVRGQMRNRIKNDEPERLARGHARREAELGCSRPKPAVGAIERIAQVGLRPRMQTSVDDIADALCFREQGLQFTGDQFELDLVNGCVLLTRDHGTVVQ